MKWFDPDRGVGLISRDDGAPDVVACRSAVHGRVDRTPLAGERVLFDITEDSAGIRADNIRRVAPGVRCSPVEDLADPTTPEPPAPAVR
ncbi:cold-shock protein [Streptomyces sp. D2-8]|uniref:cold-shock protein n=1 Tax=Streptomyces sp. D2-8 TaxID=2707767 RepID=UPI0035B4AB66|nr:cold-shock protein [Streptomyces sp. D2-8]